MSDCNAPIPPEKAAELAETLRQNAPLMAELRYWVSSIHVASVIAHNHQDEARRIRQLIAQTLGKS